MTHKTKLAKATIGLLILFLLGASLFGIGLLLGGDALDGMAGGRRENTQLQDALINTGAIFAAAGLILFLISTLALVLRNVYRSFKANH